MRIKGFKELYESSFHVERDEVNLILIRPVTCVVNIHWGPTVSKPKFMAACRENNVTYTKLSNGPETDCLEGTLADVLNVMAPLDEDNGWGLGYSIEFEEPLNHPEMKILEKYMIARGLSDFVQGYQDQLDL